MKPGPSSLALPALTAIALFVVSVALNLLTVRNEVPPFMEELYHVMAAQSWADSGEFAVRDGAYRRGSLYTIYLALGGGLLDDPIDSARLLTTLSIAPLGSLLFLVLLRPLGFAWALVCAALFVLSPHTLELGAKIRFYAPHALLFWAGAWAVYSAVTTGVARRRKLAGACAAWVLAVSLQVTALVGIFAMIVWIAGYESGRGSWRRLTARTAGVAVAVLVVAAATAAVVLPVGELWNAYVHQAEWNRGSDIRYYHWVMTDHYPAFWALLPVFAVLGLAGQPRLAAFALTMFGLPLIVHTFQGMKEDRYIFYALPAFFILVTCGLQRLHGVVVHNAREVLGRRKLSERQVERAARASSVIALAVLAFLNTGYIKSAKGILNGTIRTVEPARWDRVRDVLGRELHEASVVMTTSEAHALYYLDIVPIGIGYSRMRETPGSGEFSLDHRTGAPMISDAGSLERVLGCFVDGYLLAETRQWVDNPNTGVNAGFAAIVEARLETVEVPEGWKLKVFRWDALGDARASEDCRALQGVVDGLNR